MRGGVRIICKYLIKIPNSGREEIALNNCKVYVYNRANYITGAIVVVVGTLLREFLFTITGV